MRRVRDGVLADQCRGVDPHGFVPGPGIADQDGALVVPVAGVYPLEHIQDAVQHLLRGGKILLKVAGR